MDTTQIRNLTEDEIVAQIAEAQQELARLKFRGSYEKIENPMLLRTRRRDIARLKTILHERRSASEDQDDG